MTATGSTRATLAIVFLCFSVARALSAPLLVVYPEAPEPYREAFAQMVDGIARATRQPLLQKVVAPATTPEELRGWLGGAGRGEIAVLLGHKALSLVSFRQACLTPRNFRLNRIPSSRSHEVIFHTG